MSNQLILADGDKRLQFPDRFCLLHGSICCTLSNLVDLLPPSQQLNTQRPHEFLLNFKSEVESTKSFPNPK